MGQGLSRTGWTLTDARPIGGMILSGGIRFVITQLCVFSLSRFFSNLFIVCSKIHWSILRQNRDIARNIFSSPVISPDSIPVVNLHCPFGSVVVQPGMHLCVALVTEMQQVC